MNIFFDTPLLMIKADDSLSVSTEISAKNIFGKTKARKISIRDEDYEIEIEDEQEI
jgi:hypothetical protein